MPSISIIVTFDDGDTQSARFFDSVLAQTSPNYEVVCVHHAGQPVEGMLAGCIDVECDGTLPQMRAAGLAAASGTWCCFADSSTELAKGLVQTVATRFDDKDDHQVVAFQLQEFDPQEGCYTSVRRIMRAKRSVAPMTGEQLAGRLLQVPGMGLGDKLFRTAYLRSVDGDFEALHAFDSEPLVARALMDAGSVMVMPWQLARRTWSRAESLAALTDQQYLARVDMMLSLATQLDPSVAALLCDDPSAVDNAAPLDAAASSVAAQNSPAIPDNSPADITGDSASEPSAADSSRSSDPQSVAPLFATPGRHPDAENASTQPASPFVATYATWLLDQVVDDLEALPQERAQQLRPVVAARVLPVVDHLSAGEELGDWRKLSLLRLSLLDGEQLIQACLDAQQAERERRYDAAYAELRAERLSPSTPDSQPKKRRGLFRR